MSYVLSILFSLSDVLADGDLAAKLPLQQARKIDLCWEQRAFTQHRCCRLVLL